jgi:hypothetical protein
MCGNYINCASSVQLLDLYEDYISNPVSVGGMVSCREELVKLIGEAKAKITGQ